MVVGAAVVMGAAVVVGSVVVDGAAVVVGVAVQAPVVTMGFWPNQLQLAFAPDGRGVQYAFPLPPMPQPLVYWEKGSAGTCPLKLQPNSSSWSRCFSCPIQLGIVPETLLLPRYSSTSKDSC